MVIDASCNKILLYVDVSGSGMDGNSAVQEAILELADKFKDLVTKVYAANHCITPFEEWHGEAYGGFDMGVLHGHLYGSGAQAAFLVTDDENTWLIQPSIVIHQIPLFVFRTASRDSILEAARG